ncbi:unnamed protein product [Trifolium pratense]|uniref:Uncharacterized protein n=1 Tax=Trifolium pratense TaxID=57577 RepID=A0ACB0M5I0_TRIPR|nr:unnamed protein product [Trifolium pratense]
MLPHNMFSMLNSLAATPGCKQKRQGLVMNWNVVVWNLWRQRNKMIFENCSTDITELVVEVKVTSWKMVDKQVEFWLLPLLRME